MADRTLMSAVRVAFVGTLLAQLIVALLPLIVIVPPRLAAPVPRTALLVYVFYWVLAEGLLRTPAAATVTVTEDDKRTTATNVVALTAMAAIPLALFVTGVRVPGDLPALHATTAVHAWGAPMLLALLGVALRLWAMATLKDAFTRTLTVRHDQAIVAAGPYGVVRHPGYLANGLVFVCTALLVSGNALVAAACAVTFGVVWHRRIDAEEALLLRALPAAYARYAARVPSRLLPGVY